MSFVCYCCVFDTIVDLACKPSTLASALILNAYITYTKQNYVPLIVFSNLFSCFKSTALENVLLSNRFFSVVISFLRFMCVCAHFSFLFRLKCERLSKLWPYFPYLFNYNTRTHRQRITTKQKLVVYNNISFFMMVVRALALLTFFFRLIARTHTLPHAERAKARQLERQSTLWLYRRTVIKYYNHKILHCRFVVHLVEKKSFFFLSLKKFCFYVVRCHRPRRLRAKLRVRNDTFFH